MSRLHRAAALGVILCALSFAPLAGAQDAPADAADALTREAALDAMKRAATFYRTEVASHGGYVYCYLEDLSRRWGEGEANKDMAFTEPPGTPTVGMAYLTAYRATGDDFYLEAARETAGALLYGQLESGGWAQVIYFGEHSRRGQYRHGQGGGTRNHSSLDDNQTQSALAMLMQLDRALAFKDEAIHDAVVYATDGLLAAQFANGAFPQGWSKPASEQPVVAASYPEYDWRTENRIKNYWDYYTLNDNLAGAMTTTLLTACAIYADTDDLARYEPALRKLGDFLILAQMPEPQPAWCQQYNYDMHPMWARKFEPPAITGNESQDVMRALIRIAEYTGDHKYLGPIPRALEYLRSCVLDDGRIPRFLELKTNKPLYFTREYELTYDDSDVPTHYSFKGSAKFDHIEREYGRVKAGQTDDKQRSLGSIEKAALAALASLDDQGRWVNVYEGEGITGGVKFEHGTRYIYSRTFANNIAALAAYIKATARND